MDGARRHLSLAAELLLLAVDPGRGGLLPRRGRRRLRRALVAAGLVERDLLLRGLRLVDRAPAGERFQRLRRCMETREFPEQRDRDLFVLLASSGALAARLSSSERDAAWRRLKALVPSSEALEARPRRVRGALLSAGIAELGAVAALGTADLNSCVDPVDFGCSTVGGPSLAELSAGMGGH